MIDDRNIFSRLQILEYVSSRRREWLGTNLKYMKEEITDQTRYRGESVSRAQKESVKLCLPLRQKEDCEPG